MEEIFDFYMTITIVITLSHVSSFRPLKFLLKIQSNAYLIFIVVVINIICEDFINSITDLETNIRGLAILSAERIKAYDQLKKGMGPILFVLFSVFTFILMTVVHDAIQTFYAQKIILGVIDLTLATSLIITLMNISSISESCLEALHQLSSYHR